MLFRFFVLFIYFIPSVSMAGGLASKMVVDSLSSSLSDDLSENEFSTNLGGDSSKDDGEEKSNSDTKSSATWSHEDFIDLYNYQFKYPREFKVNIEYRDGSSEKLTKNLREYHNHQLFPEIFELEPYSVIAFIEEAFSSEFDKSERNLVRFVLLDYTGRGHTKHLLQISEALDGVEKEDFFSLLRSIGTACKALRFNLSKGFEVLNTELAAEILGVTTNSGLVAIKVGLILEEEELLFSKGDSHGCGKHVANFMTLFNKDMQEISDVLSIVSRFAHVVDIDGDYEHPGVKRLTKKDEYLYEGRRIVASRESFADEFNAAFWRRFFELDIDKLRSLTSYSQDLFLPLGSVIPFEEEEIMDVYSSTYLLRQEVGRGIKTNPTIATFILDVVNELSLEQTGAFVRSYQYINLWQIYTIDYERLSDELPKLRPDDINSYLKNLVFKSKD